jgi:FtsP/CotA-like multicopper oxidase with cupredoxin domain
LHHRDKLLDVASPRLVEADLRTRQSAPQRDRQERHPLHCHILEHEDNDMMQPYEVVS